MQRRTKAPKSERFVARVTGADKRIFQRAARLEGHSMATSVIAHAREAAARVLSEHQAIQLSAVESRRFVEALLAPPRPATQAMRAAIRAYRKLVKSDLDSA